MEGANLTKISTSELENLRFLLYQAWNNAGEMAHNQSTMEVMGTDPHYIKKFNDAKEHLKSAWMAIEATNIMPTLFSIAAADNLNYQSENICDYLPQFNAS